MSDNWIILVPDDPWHIPDDGRAHALHTTLRKIAPGSEEITSTSFDRVQFFDCGGNWEGVFCPACGSEVSDAWWSTAMDRDFSAAGGFALAPIALPCCGARSRLDQLNYLWPPAFGSFSVHAMNPDIGQLTAPQIARLERTAGCGLRIVYQHI